MPSRAHEIPLRVIQNQPAPAAVLLRESLGIDVPHHTEAIPTASVRANEAVRRELEGLMSVDTCGRQSDFARRYVGLGREEGREEGVGQGRVLEAARNVLPSSARVA